MRDLAERALERLTTMFVSLALTLALLALLPASAGAQTIASNAAKATWVNATQLESAAPIPATGPESIVQTRIVRGTCNADGTSVPTILETLNVPITVTTVLFENLPDGTFCYRARHIQENGGMSLWSVTVSKVSTQPVVVPQKTKPPSITIN